MLHEAAPFLISTVVLIAAILIFFGLARGRYAQFGVAQTILRIIVALPLVLSAVLLHFLRTNEATAMLPPLFPEGRFLVIASGVFEILGAIGLFVPKTRRSAALWIAILMVCVFPVNVFVAGQTVGGLRMPSVPMRLAMQVVYIWMVLLAGYGLPGIYFRGMRRTKEQALDYSTRSHEFIWEQLRGENFPSGPRNDLVFAYIALVLEHQNAIATLIRCKLVGSALALLRPQIETAFRGLWVNLIASESEVTAIAQTGAEPFPRFKQMAKDLDLRYGSAGWLQMFADMWGTLNGYTHSGLEQLGRRFGEDGNLTSNYPDEVVAEVAVVSGTVSIGFIVPIFRHLGLDAKAASLEEWLANNGAPAPRGGTSPSL